MMVLSEKLRSLKEMNRKYLFKYISRLKKKNQVFNAWLFCLRGVLSVYSLRDLGSFF